MRWSVVGHDEQRAYLERHVEAGTLPHALLLEGPSGIGKHLMAHDIAAELLADSILPLDGNPDCMQLAPTVDEETGKPKDIGVQAIREQLKPWAYLRPVHGAHKVAIIDDCERMGDDAANTLLKVLEEPPRFLTFILISGSPGSVLPTIASRCQHIALLPLTDDQMQEALAGQKVDADERALLAVIAQGRPGIAISLIAAKRLGEVTASITSFERALSGTLAERLVLAKNVAELDDPAEPVGWWLAYLRSRIVQHPELAPVAHALMDLHTALREPQFNRRLALERFWLER